MTAELSSKFDAFLMSAQCTPLCVCCDYSVSELFAL